MPTNPYFDNGQQFDALQEQHLIDLCTQEAIQISGQNMVYCPRTLVNEDLLLGEDTLSAFNEKYNLEVYIDNVMQFGGNGDFLGKFGVQVSDTIDLTVSRARFNTETGRDHPNEGGLFFFAPSKTLFEIKFVEHETPWYMLGRLYCFKLSCEIFNYSHEDFKTGVADIDEITEVLENTDDQVNDDFADNQVIENEANKVLDFSESHPFGELEVE